MEKQPDHGLSSLFFGIPSPAWFGEGMPPLKVEVSLTPSDEVVKLREEVSQLQIMLDGLRSDYNRLEYLYRCESIINQRLIDRCRELKVDVRDITRAFSSS